MYTQAQKDVLRVFDYAGSLTDSSLIRMHETLAPIWKMKSQSPSGLRTRRKELVKYGEVFDSGETARQPSGRRSVIWERLAL